MALRRRQAKQWTVEWQSEEGSDDVLKRIETVLNLKSGRGVVESVKARGRAIHLTWSRSVGYGGAYAWVKDIVGGLGVWRLSDASLEEPEQADQHPAPHLMHKNFALCTSKRKRNDLDSDYVCSDMALGEGAFGSSCSRTDVSKPSPEPFPGNDEESM